MPELEVIQRTRRQGISWRSLRNYAQQHGKAKQLGKIMMYSAAFIDELAGNARMRKEAAMEKLGVKSSSGFSYKVKSLGIRTLVIGRASLVRREDVAFHCESLESRNS